MSSILRMIDEVVDYLVTQGVGTAGQTVFSANLPATPTKCVAVMPQGGPRIRGDALQRPDVQILVRDESYSAGIGRAQTIWNALDHKAGMLALSRVRSVPAHEVGPYFRDNNNRYVFTLNFNFVLCP